MRYHHLILALTLLLPSLAPAADFHLTARDVKLVELELKPKVPPRLRIHLTNQKFLEAQALIAKNLDQPVSIYRDQQRVLTTTFTEPLIYRSRTLVLQITDYDVATTVARQLLPPP